MTFLPRAWIITLLSALAFTSSSCAQKRVPAESCTGKIGVSASLVAGPGHPPITEQLEAGQVVLTFDDGPAGRATHQVLDVLDAHCTRAVFFLQGDKAARDPELVAHIAARGHMIGSHSFDHANLAALPQSEAEENILRGRDAVNAALKDEAALFRFPFVARTDALGEALTRLGLIEVGVDADGEDWTGNTAEARVSRILAQLAEKDSKGIVLLHDPFPRSAETADLLLLRLYEEGYQVAIVEPAPAH